jgi:hypothetical protein
MSERSKDTLMESSKTAQRRRRYRLRAASTIGRAVATLVTIARPADAGSDRFLLAASSSDRLN